MKYKATTSQTRKMGILAVMIALMTIVYIFGASPYANDGTFGTLQAQESRGAITGLTLTSDAPGTPTVSWDAASPTPTDYRVDWAKSDEGYTSWKVNRGHVYPQDYCKVRKLDRRGGRWSALGGRRKSWLAGAWISGLETILPGAGRSDRC